MDNEPPLMTLEEAAAYLRVGPETVRRLCVAGECPGHAIKVGGNWRVNRRRFMEAIGEGVPSAEVDETVA